MVARISSASRTLELDFGYLGGFRLNEQVLFNEIHFTLDTEIIVIKITELIEVTGPKKVTIPIPASTNSNSQVDQ